MSSLTARSDRRALGLAAVIGSTFFLGLAHGIGYPLTAVSFDRWGAPGWLTGLAAGMPALAALVLLPFAPRLAFRLGLVPAMVGGCAIGLAGFVLMPLLPSVEAWLVLRFMMGIGLLFPWLLGETWINAAAEDASRGRVLSLYTVALFGGYGMGPVLLGQIGTDGMQPFLIAGSALLLAVLPLVAAASLAPRIDGHAGGNPSAVARLVPLGMSAALVAGTLEYAYIALLPSFAARLGLAEALGLGLVTAFLWGGVTLSFAFGWLADRMDRTRLMLWMLAAFPVVALVSGLATAMPGAALAATFLLGGLACAFYTLGLAILGERLRPQDLAPANAAFLVLYQVGTLAAPPVAGAAMDAWAPWGYLAAVIGFGLVALAAAIWLAGLERRRS
ncbi:MFS transporter [Microvirga tunisiensis]|uniref:MFS transporter n=2 Tax=Pannonibacter tanglangensis TaxID=2750084 RepID=A0A7X5EZL4_9HYPH|nr:MULTISPECIES: MFS transporter [unclassified Pannonibacter]NBN63343.1 MFS transporter [Pannonibacter sp. XCT-34]NBN76978.1 MFS transporter [Pannonibacter sp. XCT-53]